MLKERIGGTWRVVLNREDAWRMVPSPPRVVTMSIFVGRLPEDVVVYIGKGKDRWICEATRGSNMRETLS
jgi:hypothetical protein